MKIAILGIGAIGTAIANQLAKHSAHELYLYNRSARPDLSIKVNGQASLIKTPVQTSFDEIPNLDWLIICLKEHQFEAALPTLHKLVNQAQQIAVIRNGLRHKAPLLDIVAEERILECLIDCPTQPLGNGVYEQLRPGIIRAPQSDLGAAFKGLFNTNEMQVVLSDDFKTESWKKLCESAALGAILCLSGETCWIFEDERLQRLYADLLNESITVARADGAKIEEGFDEQMLKKLLAYPPHKGSSMLTDRLNGRAIELGAKNGIISKVAKEQGTATPLNDLVVALLSHTNAS